jgi:hypothetical protein
MRFIARLAFVLFVGPLSFSAHANLSCDPGPLNMVLNAGTISVPVNATVGSTVKTVAPDAFQFLCYMPDVSADGIRPNAPLATHNAN